MSKHFTKTLRFSTSIGSYIIFPYFVGRLVVILESLRVLDMTKHYCAMKHLLDSTLTKWVNDSNGN